MRFYLGTHHVSQPWWDLEIPLFISRRSLPKKRIPEAKAPWALDSGGFTEIDKYGEWRLTENEYIDLVTRVNLEYDHLAWVAPQDWMCEPQMLAKTGLTIEQHQLRTTLNFEKLRYHLGDLVIPVLQGWERDDYLRHWEMYEKWYFPLEHEPVVGLGSVCRRQNMQVAGEIVQSLAPLNLHGFGVKRTGLKAYGDMLTSSDSMAWSFRARRDDPLPGCVGHKNCANCIVYAERWYQETANLVLS